MAKPNQIIAVEKGVKSKAHQDLTAALHRDGPPPGRGSPGVPAIGVIPRRTLAARGS